MYTICVYDDLQTRFQAPHHDLLAFGAALIRWEIFWERKYGRSINIGYIYYGETEKHMKSASQRILQLREVMTMAVWSFCVIRAPSWTLASRSAHGSRRFSVYAYNHICTDSTLKMMNSPVDVIYKYIMCLHHGFIIVAATAWKDLDRTWQDSLFQVIWFRWQLKIAGVKVVCLG